MTPPLDPVDAILALDARLEQLERAQTAAAGPDRAAAPADPPDPRWWRQRADLADRVTLRSWGGELNDRGSLSPPFRIPDCWEDHPGLGEDLAAVHEAWRAAMVAQQAGMRTDTGEVGGGSIESSMWFTQAYWPMLDRIAGGRYRTTVCESGHQDER